MARATADWIANLAAQASAKNAAPAALPKLKLDSAPVKAAAKKQTPVGWVLDMLSRPVSGVRDSIAGSMENAVKAGGQFSKGDVAGALGTTLKAIPESVANQTKGVFSADPEQHKSTAQLEQRVLDKYNKQTGQKAEINPVVKGVTGFIGDVALDPLTYVPGPDILKGVKMLRDGGKLVANGGRDAAEVAADAARTAAQDTASPLSSSGAGLARRTEAATPDLLTSPDVPQIHEGVVENPAPVSHPDLEGEVVDQHSLTPSKYLAQKMIEAPKVADKAGEAAAKAATKTAAPTVKNAAVAAASVAGDGAAKAAALGGKADIAAFLKTLTPAAAKTGTEAVKDVSAAAPLDRIAFAKELAADPKTPDIVAGKGPSAVSKADISRIAAGDTAEFTPAELRFANRALDQKHADYVAKFNADLPKGKINTAAGNDLSKAQPASASETLAAQMQNAQAKLAASRQAAETMLGKGSVDALLGASHPDKFNSLIDDLNKTLPNQLSGKELVRPSSPVRPVRPPAQKAKVVTDPGEKSIPEDVVAPSVKEPVTTATQTAKVADEVLVQALPDASPTLRARVSQIVQSTFTHHLSEIKGSRTLGTAGQTSIARDVAKAVAADFPGKRKLGTADAFNRQARTLEALKATRQAFEAMGIPATAGKVGEEVPIGLDEVMEILTKNDRHAGLFQSNPTGATAPSQLLDAAAAIARGERDPKVLDGIVSKSLPDANGIERNPIMQSTPQTGLGARLGNMSLTNPQIRRLTVEGLLKSADDIVSTVERNSAELAARRSQETLTMTDSILKSMSDAMDNGTMADKVNALLDGPTKGVKAAQAAAHALDDSAQATEPIVKAAIPDVDAVAAQKARFIADATGSVLDKAAKPARPAGGAKLAVEDPAEAVTRATAKPAQEKFNAGAQDARAFEAETDVANGLPNSTHDYGEGNQIDFSQGLAGKNGFRSAFLHDYGMKMMGPVFRSAQTMTRTLLGRSASELSKLTKQFNPEELSTAFQHLQAGTRPVDARLRAATEALGKQLGDMFDTGVGKTSLVNNAAWREGTNINHLNLNLEAIHNFARASGNTKVGELIQFDMEKAAAAAKANGTKLADEVANQWKTMKVDDPINFIYQTKRALLKTQSEQTTAQMFHKIMGERSMTSNVAKPGYARAVAGDKGSILARYLDPNTYYKTEQLQEMAKLDTLLKQSTSLNSDFGKFVTDKLDPIMNMWKAGMTIYRPGHHVRNLVGDLSLSFLAGVDNPAVYKKALHVMGAKGSYEDMDIIKAMQSGGDFAVPNAGRKISTVTMKGGRKLDITADGFYHAAANEGTLPNFHTLEDIADNESTFGSWLRKKTAITGGRAEKIAGGVSESRDHYVRLAHFISYVEKNSKKFDNEAALYEAAGREVRKWHPDGQGLTPFERKYMRRVIPFYSWQRTAIPLIAESMLTRPGRFMAYPKLQFNLAEANGIDPNSISDPFPSDQMFPSWMTNGNEGPVAKVDGKYYSISPGIANMDVLNDYVGANPIRTIAGSLTPWIKTPAELLTGNSLQTGSSIGDVGQYIDGQIPFVNTAASVTGTSPTNSLLQGTAVANTNVTKGNKQPFDPAVVANYLTGLGIRNESQPNYIKQAQLEAKDAATKANGG